MHKLMLFTGVVIALYACDKQSPPEAESTDAALATITRQGIYAHLEYLASDALEGRLTGEPGYDLAAKYVAEQFAAIGLEPGGTEGWYQPVPLQSYMLDTATASLTVHRDGADVPLVYRQDFAIYGDKVREQSQVRGELVYAGYGVHAPQFGYSDYEGIDVAGKIVVLFTGAPAALSSEIRAHYATSAVKAREMVARGAVGAISVYSRDLEQSYPWERLAKNTGTKPGMAWVSLSGEASDYFPEILASAILSPDAASALFAGTPISFAEARDASEASTPASVPLGIQASLATRTTIDRLSSPNVIGILRGTDPDLRNEYVVYSAHLDHDGRGVEVDGDDLYNGMYDNAVGNALMIESARALVAAPPRRSIMFIALTGEEKGLLGSDYFAHYPTVPTDSIVANINIDMPLFLFPLADIIAFGAENSSLGAVAAEAANAEGFTLTPDPMPEENLFVRSDQYSFVKKGVPAICLDPGMTSSDDSVDGVAVTTAFRQTHYHQPSDDLSQPIDWDSAIRFTRANARIGWSIANADARPRWNAGNFFGEMFAPE
ncbi:MAG: M28 family metallopeptidase [Gammaproteobacteria bacterium]|nr:M28 family metallopeptidase [Gammaproteobacteria bacterium]